MHSLATTHNPTPRPAPRGHLRPPPAPTLYLRRRLYPPLAFLHPPTPHARWPPPPLAPPTLSCPGHDQVQHVGHWSCCGHDQGYESRLIFCCDNNSYNPGDGCDHELGSNGEYSRMRASVIIAPPTRTWSFVSGPPKTNIFGDRDQDCMHHCHKDVFVWIA